LDKCTSKEKKKARIPEDTKRKGGFSVERKRTS